MIVVRTVAELRAALTPPRRAGERIGLVATMGAFHAGHLALIGHAVADCDVTVVSVFVNPTQFDDPADLRAYPRDERADAAAARRLGVDVLFAPSAEEMYPAGFATTVTVGGASEPLEGASRGPGHFRGVATVVAKLLNAVAPDVAYFGEKDAQQVAVIRRMVADLDLPTAIETRPTVRDADGLALSSRNARLTGAERVRAGALHRALDAVAEAVAAGERAPAAAVAAGRAQLDSADAEIEYLELVDPATMRAVERLDRDVLAVVAARIGSVRLIDNRPIAIAEPALAAAVTGTVPTDPGERSPA